MVKPNYSFEKRQKELARKKKQEEKRLRKAAAHDEKPQDDLPAVDGTDAADAEGVQNQP